MALASLTSTRVSLSPAGAQAALVNAGPLPYGTSTQDNYGAAEVDISGNGRYIVFVSRSSDLAPSNVATPYGPTRVFRKDLITGGLICVSVDPSAGVNLGNCQDPSISYDGNRIAFVYLPDASDTWTGLAGVSSSQIMVRDVISNTLQRCTRRHSDGGPTIGGNSRYCWISGNGDRVGFITEANDIHTSKTNTSADVMVFDTSNNALVHCSFNLVTGSQQNGQCTHLALDYTGRLVAFDCNATNLIQEATNGCHQVYRRDVDGTTLDLVTRVPSTGLAFSTHVGVEVNSVGGISHDGNKIVLTSYSPSVVPAANTGKSDVFVVDMLDGSVTQASQSTLGVKGAGTSADPHIDPLGRFVVFESNATNLIDGTTLGVGFMHAYIRDLELERTECLSRNTDGTIATNHTPLCQRPGTNTTYTGTWSSASIAPTCVTVTNRQGTLTSGSAIVTSISSTTGISAGQSVTGSAGIAAGTTVASVDSATQITLSANATSSGASFMEFSGVIWGIYHGSQPRVARLGTAIWASDYDAIAGSDTNTIRDVWVSRPFSFPDEGVTCVDADGGYYDATTSGVVPICSDAQHFLIFSEDAEEDEDDDNTAVDAIDLRFINAALTRTGADPIDSINDASAMAIVAARNYTEMRKQWFDHRWRFATATATLTLSDDEADAPWTYTYDLPLDFALMRDIKVAGASVPFALRDNNQVMLDADEDDEPTALYIRVVREHQWPGYFAKAATADLEVLFLRAREKYGEADAVAAVARLLWAQAKRTDSQSETRTDPIVSTTLRARRGS